MKRILIALLSVSCTVFVPAGTAQTAKKTTPTSTHATTKTSTAAKTSASTKTSASSKTAGTSKTAAKATTKTKSTSNAKSGTTSSAKGTASASSKTSKHGRKTAVVRRPSYQTAPTPERYQQIQQSLADRGFYKGEVNGLWGADSVDAMKRFQESQNLPDDGKITSKALIELGLGSTHTPPTGTNQPNANQPGTAVPPNSTPAPSTGGTTPATPPANPPQPAPPSVTSQR